MSQRTLIGLLVGAHFNPPAKLLLTVMSGETELRLIPDPDNPYDGNAIRVLMNPADLPEQSYQQLEQELPAAGCTLEQLMSQSEVMLGHVGASNGKPLSKARQNWPELAADLTGNQEFLAAMAASPEHSAKLGFAPTGDPLVVLTAESSR